ncbi:hypothetical protein FPV67DRAFT_1660184 [Lyophyllum atratum]|nr:hypothetical protein FPV67DRAFT_1660184 [Lyophyllum atratum]
MDLTFRELRRVVPGRMVNTRRGRSLAQKPRGFDSPARFWGEWQRGFSKVIYLSLISKPHAPKIQAAQNHSGKEVGGRRSVLELFLHAIYDQENLSRKTKNLMRFTAKIDDAQEELRELDEQLLEPASTIGFAYHYITTDASVQWGAEGRRLLGGRWPADGEKIADQNQDMMCLLNGMHALRMSAARIALLRLSTSERERKEK